MAIKLSPYAVKVLGKKTRDNIPALNPAPSFSEQREGYPIPQTEEAFAADERAAIIQFDGGPHGPLVEIVKDVFEGTIH